MPDYASKTFSDNMVGEFAQLAAQIPAIRAACFYEVYFKTMDGLPLAFYERNPDPSVTYSDLEDRLGAMSQTSIYGMATATAKLSLGEWDYFVCAGPDGRALYMALPESKEMFLILIVERNIPLGALVRAVKANWEPIRALMRD